MLKGRVREPTAATNVVRVLLLAVLLGKMYIYRNINEIEKEGVYLWENRIALYSWGMSVA
jgi:hypothetical protein